MLKIPFNKPYMTGRELEYIRQAYEEGWLAGNGSFTRRCQEWLEKNIGCARAFVTHSGTAALEMAAILADIKPGDEVIMPSFTFVGTATAFVLRGGVPVFVDIRPDTLNIDETKIAAAVTSRTKAIVPVHYAGVGCEMSEIIRVAREHELVVIEDAAHGMMARHMTKPLGSQGHLAALSFHETKNIISGEGGALLVNDPRFVARAEIVAEKGTNRRRFFRGEVDKYSWEDVGSSFFPSELVTAFLWAQLEKAEEITRERKAVWQEYHQAFEDDERDGLARRPIVPALCEHNAHIYYLVLPDSDRRQKLLEYCHMQGIGAISHYVPLHSSPAGKKFGRVSGSMAVTDTVSERLVRLPLWKGVASQVPEIVRTVKAGLRL